VSLRDKDNRHGTTEHLRGGLLFRRSWQHETTKHLGFGDVVVNAPAEADAAMISTCNSPVLQEEVLVY
jgi:hypothetical protein